MSTFNVDIFLVARSNTNTNLNLNSTSSEAGAKAVTGTPLPNGENESNHRGSRKLAQHLARKKKKEQNQVFPCGVKTSVGSSSPLLCSALSTAGSISAMSLLNLLFLISASTPFETFEMPPGETQCEVKTV
ncbi:uncharacterized [Tachysurus ichikawai]